MYNRGIPRSGERTPSEREPATGDTGEVACALGKGAPISQHVNTRDAMPH